jgi:hypothetical protein
LGAQDQVLEEATRLDISPTLAPSQSRGATHLLVRV